MGEGSAVAVAALRTGFSSQPQPTSHFTPWAHSQWTMDSTSALMPSHLCSR
ncbi:hypothetical protein D3C85_1877870 [compost metagenome]